MPLTALRSIYLRRWLKLARAHCTAAGLKITGENLRKILDGTETLFRLECVTESEFDKCLAIQKDFYSTAEVNRIRAVIRGAGGVAAAKRKCHTYQAYDGNEAPDDAIFIIYDENNHKTYLGTAWFSSDLLPAKIILKEQREVFVSYGANEVQVNEFNFVRMDPGTYNWKQGMKGDVPENAVIAGCTEDGETLYFGRPMYNGNYIPGKVHPSHGVLYVPFRGQGINFLSYDVLVHANDS
ncbi:hypothetical protein HA402_001248 [Bradysia odoriphaga]|nr:hypothetical protein HA402_001248 [Bradysia odoriphaga]